MEDTPNSARMVRFGSFEVDQVTGELRKGGVRIKLQDQPFRVLAELTKRPKELVTREELREKLWPGDTYVEFDQNLNAVIKKVRQALGDSAENPRFIETLPKKGYRFVYPVEGAGDAAAAPAPQQQGVSKPANKATPSAGTVSRSQRVWIAGFGVAAVVTLGLVIAPRVGDQIADTGNSPPTPKSIAVLPLENLSGDPEQEYFSDGMTDALISSLGKISALKVISRTSAMRYKDTDKALQQIAQELNVSHVVEGSVLKAGDEVRITAQLIDAVNDRQLWSNNYQRPLRDILRVQGEVARAVAREIEVNLTPQEEARLATARTVNPEAYAAYLKGIDWTWRGDMEKGVQLFQEAVEKDPGDPLAWVGLGESSLAQTLYGEHPRMAQREARNLSRAAFTTALQLDETLVEAQRAMGVLQEAQWEWAGAEQSFRRALELNPSDAMAHQQYAHLLIMTGRPGEARGELVRTLELDPVSVRLKALVAWLHGMLGDYDRAIELCRDVLDNDPTALGCHRTLGWAYVHQQRYDEALAEFEQAPGLGARTGTGYVYALQGHRDKALEVLRELDQASKQRYVSPYGFAVLYAGLGDYELSLDRLEKASEGRDWVMTISLPADRVFEPLRSHPRFEALLKKMNLPELSADQN